MDLTLYRASGARRYVYANTGHNNLDMYTPGNILSKILYFVGILRWGFIYLMYVHSIYERILDYKYLIYDLTPLINNDKLIYSSAGKYYKYYCNRQINHSIISYNNIKRIFILPICSGDVCVIFDEYSNLMKIFVKHHTLSRINYLKVIKNRETLFDKPFHYYDWENTPVEIYPAEYMKYY